MNSDHYMQKLRSIREKYSGSQTKISPLIHRTTYIDRYNPQTSFRDRKIILDKNQDASTYTSIQNKIQNITGKSYPYSSSSYRPTQFKQSRRLDTERQIEQLRQNYANTRRKIMQGYPRESLRENGKYNSRQVLDRDINIQKYQKQAENYKNYGRERIHSYACEDQSSSPIKRMHQISQNKVAKLQQNSIGISSQNYWRDRQTRLSELTSNRLNEMRSSRKNDQLIKRSSLPKGIDYQKPINYSPSRNRSTFRDYSQNKSSGYTVSNIQNIQNRIQSILGNRH